MSSTLRPAWGAELGRLCQYFLYFYNGFYHHISILLFSKIIGIVKIKGECKFNFGFVPSSSILAPTTRGLRRDRSVPSSSTLLKQHPHNRIAMHAPMLYWLSLAVNTPSVLILLYSFTLARCISTQPVHRISTGSCTCSMAQSRATGKCCGQDASSLSPDRMAPLEHQSFAKPSQRPSQVSCQTGRPGDAQACDHEDAWRAASFVQRRSGG